MDQQTRRKLRRYNRRHGRIKDKWTKGVNSSQDVSNQALNAAIAKQAGLTGNESKTEQIALINDMGLYSNAIPRKSKHAVRSATKTSTIVSGVNPNNLDQILVRAFSKHKKPISQQQVKIRICWHFIGPFSGPIQENVDRSLHFPKIKDFVTIEANQNYKIFSYSQQAFKSLQEFGFRYLTQTFERYNKDKERDEQKTISLWYGYKDQINWLALKQFSFSFYEELK